MSTRKGWRLRRAARLSAASAPTVVVKKGEPRKRAPLTQRVMAAIANEARIRGMR